MTGEMARAQTGPRASFRQKVTWLCALLLLCAINAQAVTVITPRNDATNDILKAQAAAKSVVLGHYGMIPIPASLIEDGEYPVEVQSTSPFFKITEALLQVSGGEMSADITIGSLSYDKLRMDETIEGTQAGGVTIFHIPVPALNASFDCAAHSVNRDQWYDRQLLISAASLPEGALTFDLPDYAAMDRALMAFEAEASSEPELTAVEPMSVELSDGEYAIEVNLSGGSGRASVSSPTLLRVKDGQAWAQLTWSSAYYDYMLLGGVRYENQSNGGNSTFEIPVAAMDVPLTVVADTTAMGDPVEIEYQLTFYGESIGDRRQVPQEAAKQVLMISLGIIVVGGILNAILKKRRR